ncbi:hypothetical protein [Glutamicibacter creatinolyticus]|uniref:hypothetical protein n=1 Tax=Glutamicibacter creatinolyticus TaxID=162496 RepID=UPI0031DF53FC
MSEVLPFPFATLEDLRLRWPEMPEGQDDRIEVLLEDASQYILDVCPTAADVSERTRRRVLCSVVRRALQTESQEELGGMESLQYGTGPFSQTIRPNNPHGDFYLTRQERIALGHGKQVAFTVPMVGYGGQHQFWCNFRLTGGPCSCGAVL